jgi:hypothetical protein
MQRDQKENKVMLFFSPVYADGQENYSSNCCLLFSKDTTALGKQNMGGESSETAFSSRPI